MLTDKHSNNAEYFDNNEVIDVDALESFVLSNKDELCDETSDDFFVDLK